jgi:hypothetical protein
VNSFAEREKERAAGQHWQLVKNAEIENACVDHACELAGELQDYLRQKALQVNISRTENLLILTRQDGRTLRVSTHDHMTYEVMGTNPITDQLRGTYLSRIVKRRMIDEVLTWLDAP